PGCARPSMSRIAGSTFASAGTWAGISPRRFFRPRRSRNRSPEMNPLRYLRDGARWLRDPYRFLDEAQQRSGLTFRVRLPVLGDILMTGDPDLVVEIIQHKDLDAGRSIVPAMESILGSRSVIMLEGNAHPARHRLIASLFRGEAL